MTCDSAHSARGAFVTFEGGEGAGKSTHIAFLAEALRGIGYEVVLLREPGGTDIGEKLRDIVLDPGNSAMADECELLIYEAARAQLVGQVIAPALRRGAVVVCDRFCDSTLAYQVYGRGLDEDLVRRANDFACQGVRPDRTILMVPPSVRAGLRRATKRAGADRLESAGSDFHARVHAAFDVLAEREPQRIRTVRSATKKSETAREVFRQLEDLFPEFSAIVGDAAFFASLDGKGGRLARKGESADAADMKPADTPVGPAASARRARATSADASVSDATLDSREDVR